MIHELSMILQVQERFEVDIKALPEQIDTSTYSELCSLGVRHLLTQWAHHNWSFMCSAKLTGCEDTRMRHLQAFLRSLARVPMYENDQCACLIVIAEPHVCSLLSTKFCWLTILQMPASQYKSSYKSFCAIRPHNCIPHKP